MLYYYVCTTLSAFMSVFSFSSGFAHMHVSGNISKVLRYVILFIAVSMAGCNSSTSVSSKDTADVTGESYRGLLVSNQPLYLLAKAATQGIETPKTIMTGADIGHHYHLKPLDRKSIADASHIFWIGAELEAPLSKLLEQQPKAASILYNPAIKALPVRDEKGHVAQNNTRDPHVWLDPERAKFIVQFIAAQRAALYPEHANNYLRNSNEFAKRMDAAIEKVNQSLGSKDPSAKHHYVAYHDAYQYIEPTLNLALIGSLTASAEQPVKASQLVWLQQQRKETKPLCVLSDSHAAATRLSLLEPVQVVAIDESMQSSDDFVSGWQALAQRIIDCV